MRERRRLMVRKAAGLVVDCKRKAEPGKQDKRRQRRPAIRANDRQVRRAPEIVGKKPGK